MVLGYYQRTDGWQHCHLNVLRGGPYLRIMLCYIVTSNESLVGRPTALQVSTEPYGGTTLLTKHGNPQLPRQSISIQIQSVSMQSKKKKHACINFMPEPAIMRRWSCKAPTLTVLHTIWCLGVVLVACPNWTSSGHKLEMTCESEA